MSARIATIAGVAIAIVCGVLGAYFWFFEIDAVVGPASTTIDVGGVRLQLLPRRTVSWMPWLRPTQLRAEGASGETLWTARVGTTGLWFGAWPLVGDGETVVVVDDRGLHAFDLRDGRPLFDGPVMSLDIDGLHDLGDVLILTDADSTRVVDRETGALRWERAHTGSGEVGAFDASAVEIDGVFYDRATGEPRPPVLTE